MTARTIFSSSAQLNRVQSGVHGAADSGFSHPTRGVLTAPDVLCIKSDILQNFPGGT